MYKWRNCCSPPIYIDIRHVVWWKRDIHGKEAENIIEGKSGIENRGSQKMKRKYKRRIKKSYHENRPGVEFAGDLCESRPPDMDRSGLFYYFIFHIHETTTEKTAQKFSGLCDLHGVVLSHTQHVAYTVSVI